MTENFFGTPDEDCLIKAQINTLICSFIKEYEQNPQISTRWGNPLVGFADAKHHYILNLKRTISENHLFPADVLVDASIVISYFVPFAGDLSKTNTVKTRLASPEWALAYEETNAMFGHLNAHIIQTLVQAGHGAACTKEATTFNTRTLISNWSQRHIAYAAGLGTFGLNNMLITPNGCCGRFSSVVTNLNLVPGSPLTEDFCLFKKNGSCRICIRNCPAQALSESGYNREKCYAILKENAALYTDFGSSYFDETGEDPNSSGSEVCGKCITASPCAFYHPKQGELLSRKKY